ncbi:MAG TPA: hypothetical protein PLA06_06820 [Syntrophorhabdaceae bacterium]|jgi:hypothetical protein|nr:hypothetical protein [Pseudomonadota bacterium]HQP51872.1 hypothetical protein [Syntrophorhabdaceae bacterium]
MIKKFSELDPTESFKVKDTIKVGCHAVKCYCSQCGGKTIGLKMPGNIYTCSKCDKNVVPISGENEFTTSLPYFVVPDSIKNVIGEKPEKLIIIPAYSSINRTIPNSYARYAQNGAIYCTGDGVSAKRYDPATRTRSKIVNCSDICPDKKKGVCKASATFYFYLPEIDIFSGYKLVTRSEISIKNIISTLRRLSDKDGNVSRIMYELAISEKKRASDGKTYRVLELLPPAMNINELMELKSGEKNIFCIPKAC